MRSELRMIENVFNYILTVARAEVHRKPIEEKLIQNSTVGDGKEEHLSSRSIVLRKNSWSG